MATQTFQPTELATDQESTSPAFPRQQPLLALRRFVRGAQQVILYPSDHPSFEDALRRAFDGCRKLLTLFPTWTLQVGPDDLSLMGESLPSEGHLDRFGQRLRERMIPALTFVEGATEQELLELLRVLATPPQAIEAQGGAELCLGRAGVRHILLKAPDAPPAYQAEWASFVAGQETADGTALEKLLSLCPESCRTAQEGGEIGAGTDDTLAWLVGVLGATAARLPEGAPAREQWLQQTLLAIRELTPALERSLFRVYPCHERDALGDVASLLAPEQAAELLLGYPNAVVGEPSAQLEAVLKRLMPNRERALQVEPLVKETLLSRGMTEESYDSVVSLVLRRHLNAVALPLDLKEARGEVRSASLLTDIIATVSARALQENRLEMLLELTSSPSELEGRDQLATHLAEELVGSLPELADGRAADVLRRVEEAIAFGTLSPQDKRLLRLNVTQASSPDLCRRMARFLLREPRQENAFLLGMIARAEEGFDALLLVATEASVAWLQGSAGSAILRMGERSAEGCYQILRSAAPKEAIALARALVLSGGQESLGRALWALEHPDPEVVAGLMEALAHSRDEAAELVLLEALQAGCPEIQEAAALSLGGHPSDGAVAALSSLLAGPFALRRADLVTSAVKALGQIGRPECVPPLRALLKRKSLLRRRQTRELQALAAEALAAIPDPAAEQVLQEEATRGSTELSSLCKRALEQRHSMPQAEPGHVRT
jgi:hypothetical protein